MRPIAALAVFGAVAVFGSSSASAQDFLGQLLKSAAGQIAAQALAKAVVADAPPAPTPATDAPAPADAAAAPESIPGPTTETAYASPASDAPRPETTNSRDRRATNSQQTTSTQCQGYSDPRPQCQW